MNYGTPNRVAWTLNVNFKWIGRLSWSWSTARRHCDRAWCTISNASITLARATLRVGRLRSWSPRGRVAIDEWLHPTSGRESRGDKSKEDHSELVLLGKHPASQSEYPCRWWTKLAAYCTLPHSTPVHPVCNPCICGSFRWPLNLLQCCCWVDLCLSH